MLSLHSFPIVFSGCRRFSIRGRIRWPCRLHRQEACTSKWTCRDTAKDRLQCVPALAAWAVCYVPQRTVVWLANRSRQSAHLQEVEQGNAQLSTGRSTDGQFVQWPFSVSTRYLKLGGFHNIGSAISVWENLRRYRVESIHFHRENRTSVPMSYSLDAQFTDSPLSVYPCNEELVKYDAMIKNHEERHGL